MPQLMGRLRLNFLSTDLSALKTTKKHPRRFLVQRKESPMAVEHHFTPSSMRNDHFVARLQLAFSLAQESFTVSTARMRSPNQTA